MADRGFSKKDEALVELLMGTGMPKNVAKTLAFLRSFDLSPNKSMVAPPLCDF
jgi:predicted transcriptional regulator